MRPRHLLGALALTASTLVGCGQGDGRPLVRTVEVTDTGELIAAHQRIADQAAAIAALTAERDQARAEVQRLTAAPPRASRSGRRSVTTTSQARARRGSGACGGWADLIGSYAWDVRTACRVMLCESGGNPNARNPRSSARGLFQILGGPLDPAANVALAYRMYQQRGWAPWVCA